MSRATTVRDQPREAAEFPGSRMRRAPGPPARAAVGVLREVERAPLDFLLKIRRRYGDVVRMRFLFWDAYLLSHPDHVKHVLQDRHGAYTKDTYDYRMLRPLVGNGLLTSDGEFWLRQRRLMQPAFHRQRIAGFVDMMGARTLAMLERWDDAARRGVAVDVVAEMSRLAMDIVTRALFSIEIGARAEDVARAATTLNRFVTESFFSPFSLLLPASWRANRATRTAHQTLTAVVDGIVADWRRRNEDTGDLLSMLLLARDEDTGEGMSDGQVREEVLTLLLAGHETTANALAWTWYLLSTHPEIAARVRREAAGRLGGRAPTMDDVPALGYTRMVLDESMRLYPPVWATSRAPSEPDRIGGYEVTKGALVLLSPYVTHRHPAIWERPDAFDPERFRPEQTATRPRFAYFPFGGGPRQCIGNTFAFTEATVVLAGIAQRYHLEMVPGHPVVPEPLVTLRPKFGLQMTLRPV
jgi:cytochrome P450